MARRLLAATFATLPAVLLGACFAARGADAPRVAATPAGAARPVVVPLPPVTTEPEEEGADTTPPDATPPELLPSPGPAVPAPPALPALVRVGLATDLDQIRPDCCAGAPHVLAAGLDLPLEQGSEIAPAAEAAGLGSYRLQVAALKDPAQAELLAGRLGRQLAQPAEVVFDARSDLFKVHVGRYPDRGGAEAAKLQLARTALGEAFIVHEDRGLAAAGLVLRQGGRSQRVEGRVLRIASAERVVTWAARHYRGALLVYLNDRGKLNVINELPFEDYLRGVVPRELGPALYPELEALKAQAVAARTYALRNLGREFAAEGYDVCATPRCQVYGGRDAEHPLSDRAVAETAGEILVHRGAPIDALYSATCGGHTERVDAIFPERRAAYLKPVPCLESGTVRLRVAGAPVPEATLGAWLEERGEAGKDYELRSELFLELRGDLLLTHAGGRRSGQRVSAATALFAGGGSPVDSLRLAAGDPLRLYLVGGRLAGLVQDLPAGNVEGIAPPRQARHGPWTRFREEAALRGVVAALYPGFELRELEVASRGASGRVSKLILHGAGDRQEVVEGLAVRFTLDVPDTWFEVERVSEPGRSGWTLRGRGWGHGVGLCQVGAYRMAQRGIAYRPILEHYYSDVRLERLEPVVDAAGARASSAGPAGR
jgi:peptidoglycan hydrolase-like amidase